MGVGVWTSPMGKAVPEARHENSPAIHRWDLWDSATLVPESLGKNRIPTLRNALPSTGSRGHPRVGGILSQARRDGVDQRRS
jgi:hypothetical protein